MSRSWNHTLTPYTAEELQAWEEREALCREKFGEPRLGPLWNPCSSPRCTNRPVAHATYDYVTGRAGRVSWARRHLCADHAERFAEKHGLEYAATVLPSGARP